MNAEFSNPRRPEFRVRLIHEDGFGIDGSESGIIENPEAGKKNRTIGYSGSSVEIRVPSPEDGITQFWESFFFTLAHTHSERTGSLRETAYKSGQVL